MYSLIIHVQVFSKQKLGVMRIFISRTFYPGADLEMPDMCLFDCHNEELNS